MSKITTFAHMTSDTFSYRHIGPRKDEIQSMLEIIGASSIDDLIQSTVPEAIRLNQPINIPGPVSEREYLSQLKALALQNKIFRSYIGLGYYNTILPSVIKRNILENPGWYTAYTPYQSEISQGRLEALLNFQTMISDLTGLPVSNASLLDEATAAAEAMVMFYNAAPRPPNGGEIAPKRHRFFVSEECFPQTIDVLITRAEPLKIEIVTGNWKTFVPDDTFFGALVQYPDLNGAIHDYRSFTAGVQANGIRVVVATDLLALTLIPPPGEWGADAAVGSSQRFGIPMGYGGPHAAFFATRDEFKRLIPGRIIGVSVDADGNRALRMALQTREQHIKREKATSNICTSQVLLAVIASMYAVYHGSEGIKAIARRIHHFAVILSKQIQKSGYRLNHSLFFDTISVVLPPMVTIEKIKALAEKNQMNFRYASETVFISIDETTCEDDIEEIVKLFRDATPQRETILLDGNEGSTNGHRGIQTIIPQEFQRTTPFLTHSVFNSYHSETAMMRYIKTLENKDLSLTRSMISLGSCTMKLNAATELIPLTWEEFADLHPFAPAEQCTGYKIIISELSNFLCEITGFGAVSFQPNSGAQGEYTGLLVIRKYFKSRGESHRNVALIPQSAHGTNPASAAMAGMKIVIIKCDDTGNIDLNDLKEKAEMSKDALAVFMVTYPSTHGVFEENIVEINRVIHSYGGQVYMDGANLNAQLGLTNPAIIGADVCHLNLHKTFAIPHGGGGPGMGPIAVKNHLAPFLPSHPVIFSGDQQGIHAVSASPYGSALILLISYSYIKMLGNTGLTQATKFAILNANYIAKRLESSYPLLYKGKNGKVAHEFIADCRIFKKTAGIEVLDIAKRLMDYGYHAPTVSFPVAGTLMIEPTESESKKEIDLFCDAMIAIRKEIGEIEEGKADPVDNVLKNSPHPAYMLISSTWQHPYSREKAGYPAKWVMENKYWPPVRRVDNAYGDRNLVCTCAPAADYSEV